MFRWGGFLNIWEALAACCFLSLECGCQIKGKAFPELTYQYSLSLKSWCTGDRQRQMGARSNCWSVSNLNTTHSLFSCPLSDVSLVRFTEQTHLHVIKWKQSTATWRDVSRSTLCVFYTPYLLSYSSGVLSEVSSPEAALKITQISHCLHVVNLLTVYIIINQGSQFHFAYVELRRARGIKSWMMPKIFLAGASRGLGYFNYLFVGLLAATLQ